MESKKSRKFEDKASESNLPSFKLKSDSKPKISSFYYINKNKARLSDLKEGRRVFLNNNEIIGYKNSKETHIEFRQLFFENLLLNDDLSDNPSEAFRLQSAICSTFVYDPEMIEPLIEKHKIDVLIIKDSDVFKTEHIERNEHLLYVHPAKNYNLKWGKFHAKLFLFKFPETLRIVVSSANLCNVDWYYLSQVIWFQDFTKKKQTDDSEFARQLDEILSLFLEKDYFAKPWFKKMGFDIKDFDFQDACVDFVLSVPGIHKSTEKYGICRVKRLLQDYMKKNLNFLDYQCSSVGNLKESFVSEFTNANPFGQVKISIVFPTSSFVQLARLGAELSDCLFLNKSTFEKHKSLFKVLTVKEGIEKQIFHSKCFVIRKEQNKIEDDCIIYIGSHNFSAAAWGNVQKQGTQLAIANYELGVLFHPSKLRLEEKEAIVQTFAVELSSKQYSNELPFTRDQ